MIKINQDLTREISTNYLKQEILYSFVKIIHSIGALAIVKGIEHTNEALYSQDLGVDILQGYLFSEPIPKEKLKGFSENKLATAKNQLSTFHDKKEKTRKNEVKELESIISEIFYKIIRHPIDEFEFLLTKHLDSNPNILTITITDQNFTKIICDVNKKNGNTKITGKTKDIYSKFKNDLLHKQIQSKKTISYPILSLFSGKPCTRLIKNFKKQESYYNLIIELDYRPKNLYL